MPDIVTRIDELADELQAKAGRSPAHRAAHTLIAGTAPLRETVIALSAGAHLSEHENPGYATLHVLRGEARLVAGPDAWALPEAAHVVVPDMRHSVEAVSDTVFLLSVVLAGEDLPIGH